MPHGKAGPQERSFARSGGRGTGGGCRGSARSSEGPQPDGKRRIPRLRRRADRAAPRRLEAGSHRLAPSEGAGRAVLSQGYTRLPLAEAPFVHLHVHSEYSILDGACRIPALAARAAELDMPAVALTDHGSLAGAVELYREAGKHGVKPLIGCEVYVADDRRAQAKGYAHLTLLAESNEGYGNLIKLASAGYLEGYYYKPRVDWELLGRHAHGIVALSGCLSGRVAKAFEENRPADAAADLDRLVQTFGRDSVYVEIQNAGLEVQKRVNPQLVELAQGTGLPLVATGDVHYLRHEDALAHEALLCIQSGDSLKNPNRWRFDTDQFFFKSPAEMAADFPGHEDALRRSLELAERCIVTMELGRILLPEYPTPEGRDAFEYLVELCENGLHKRYDQVTPELTERLQFELKTVKEMGFADYFLIVWDFIRFAKQNGISVGPGRGSSAGSRDVHYLRHEDALAHEALLCIQSGDSLKNPNRWRFDTDQFFFKSPAEMAADFPGHEDALRRSLELAERCIVTMELGRILLPEYPTPEGRDAFEYLVELCENGLHKRYDQVTPELTERLQFELKTVKEMGFADYFLIVWDFIRFAKQNGISVGPGRGSSAGSLAAYCLQITDVDPIRYGLLFERFLNPARKDLPDMDIDFSVAGRERVINYVAEKYGRDRVAQIITFGTMAARAAVRDAGRVLEVPYGTVDRIAKMIPEGPGQSLDACLKPGQELKTAVDADPVAKEIVELAKPLEGLVRQDSIHAAGVVIGAQPLTDVVPL
ncbi:MAG: PHP domain-containing protein, partial [Actinobacteria bacterium]